MIILDILAFMITIPVLCFILFVAFYILISDPKALKNSLFDYTELTELERTVFKRILIPLALFVIAAAITRAGFISIFE